MKTPRQQRHYKFDKLSEINYKNFLIKKKNEENVILKKERDLWKEYYCSLCNIFFEMNLKI